MKITDAEAINVALQLLNLILQIFGILILIVTIIYASKEFSQSDQVHKETLEWNKKTATENELATKPNIKTLNKLTRIFKLRGFTGAIPLQTIRDKNGEKADKEGQIFNNINHVLNKYDRIARGVRNDIYIESIVKDSIKNTFSKAYNNYYQYIEMKQETNPALWLDFTNLVEKWFPNSRHLKKQNLNNSITEFFENTLKLNIYEISLEKENWYLLSYKESLSIKNKLLTRGTLYEDLTIVGVNHFGLFLVMFDKLGENKLQILDSNIMSLNEIEAKLEDIIDHIK